MLKMTTPISTGEFRRKTHSTTTTSRRFTIDEERAYETTTTSPAINRHTNAQASTTSRFQQGIYALGNPQQLLGANLRIETTSRSAQSSSLSPSSSSTLPSSNRNSSNNYQSSCQIMEAVQNPLYALGGPEAFRSANDTKYISPIVKARAALEAKKTTTLLYKSKSERNLANALSQAQVAGVENVASRPKQNSSKRHTSSSSRDETKSQPIEADDELKLDEIDYTRDDYKQLVLHYKNLCKSYKRQLIDSHKTIRELHLTIEQMENKNWTQKKQKASTDLMRLESENSASNLALDKLSAYFEKLNEYIVSESSDEDSGCSNDRASNNSSEKYEQSSDKVGMMTNVLKSVIKEKRETKVFTKSFLKMAYLINPESSLVAASIKNYEKINLEKLNKILNETNEYLMVNSLASYACKCGGEPGGQDAVRVERHPTSTSVQPLDLNNNSGAIARPSGLLARSRTVNSAKESSLACVKQQARNTHKPSTEFMVNCLDTFQDLFNVKCFQSIPEKLNDIYYRYGQLLNFKRSIQNIIDPEQNYSTEKLTSAVQTIHDQLNGQFEENLKKFLNISKLNRVVDRFKIYNEYFPLFNILLEEIMKTLEISRLDQIMPSIRALKILATPTL